MPTSIEAIIDRQLRRWEHDRRHVSAGGVATEARAAFQPIITVSRQHGSRGREVAARVAERLGYTLLHRNMIDRIQESTGYTQRLLEALDEHARSMLQIWIDSMVWGKYVDENDYAIGLLKTVRSIASLGGVVVVGRGANFIVGPGGGVHVRIVAPPHERVLAIMERQRVSEADAEREVRAVDAERAKFVRKLFGGSVDDPLGYDLVVNESGRSTSALVDIVVAAATEKMERLRTM